VKRCFKLWQAVAPLAVLVMVSSCATAPEQPVATLDTPANLVLNRGHVQPLSFGGPMGLSWDDVEDRQNFSVLVFRNAENYDPSAAFDRVDGIDALYLNVNVAFDDLSDGPFWFRVQALADEDFSSLSEPMGPFWYARHSDEFSDNAQGSFAIFDDPAIPVLALDTRRLTERQAQGHIEGDAHVLWANQLAVEEGFTHADFKENVLTAWRNFIANDLTPEQRANLDPALGYKDIHMFLYCGTASRTVPAARAVATMGFINVYNIGGFVANPSLRYVFPAVGLP